MARRLALAVATLPVALLLAAPAPAQVNDDSILPKARANAWTAERLRKVDPPFINGAIAQIRGNGEGRFAIICERGDAKGLMVYRSPAGTREALLAKGNEIQVTFTFDRSRKVNRKMRWNEDGRFWQATFGPTSRIAKLMKQKFNVVVNPRGANGVSSDFTLKSSWRSIEKMFSMCGI
ncbi:MAG: hypothetical protein AAF192_02370 [Pseudomonadota bacterium]